MVKSYKIGATPLVGTTEIPPSQNPGQLIGVLVGP